MPDLLLAEYGVKGGAFTASLPETMESINPEVPIMNCLLFITHPPSKNHIMYLRNMSIAGLSRTPAPLFGIIEHTSWKTCHLTNLP